MKLFGWFTRDPPCLREIDGVWAVQFVILNRLKEIKMTLDEILVKVQAESTVDDSIIALLTGISQQLKDALALNDPAKLQAVADGIDANIAKIQAAVVANTPAAPPVP